MNPISENTMKISKTFFISSFMVLWKLRIKRLPGLSAATVKHTELDSCFPFTYLVKHPVHLHKDSELREQENNKKSRYSYAHTHSLMGFLETGGWMAAIYPPTDIVHYIVHIPYTRIRVQHCTVRSNRHTHTKWRVQNFTIRSKEEEKRGLSRIFQLLSPLQDGLGN